MYWVLLDFSMGQDNITEISGVLWDSDRLENVNVIFLNRDLVFIVFVDI